MIDFFRKLFRPRTQPSTQPSPSIYFTSDQHYGHGAICQLAGRPFSSVFEMDRALIDNHNNAVRADDIVFHLGDFCWNSSHVGKYLSQLNGTHVLIPGNHDACFANKRKWGNAARKYLDQGFSLVIQGAPWEHIVLTESGTVEHVTEDTLADGYVPHDLWGRAVGRLSHLPYTLGTDTDPRYADIRPDREGLPLIHGHVHNSWTTSDRRVNVSVERWSYRPVAAETLISICRNMKNSVLHEHPYR